MACWKAIKEETQPALCKKKLLRCEQKLHCHIILETYCADGNENLYKNGG